MSFDKLVMSLISLAHKPGPLVLWQAFLEAIDEPEYPRFAMPEPRDDLYKTTVLVTGGLDSTIGYFLSGRRSHPLYIDFGQPYANAELHALRAIGIKPEVLDYCDTYRALDPGWKHILPARNLLALILAAEQTSPGGSVWFCVTRGESPLAGGDKSQKFLKLVEQMYGLYYGGIHLKTMTRHTKGEWVQEAIREGVTDEQILSTYSCFTGEVGFQCGKCQACLRRYLALRWAGYTEKEVLHNYRAHPLEATEYVEKYRREFGKEVEHPGSTRYDHRRAVQDMQYLIPDGDTYEHPAGGLR